jgi:O-antigen ligase
MSILFGFIAALLSYHGGLHAWQAVVASLLLAVALWLSPPRLTRGEGFFALLLCALSAGTAWALDPQAHLNSLLAVAAGLALFALARREAAWTPARAAKLWLALGVLLSGLFVAAGFGLAGHFSGTDLSGPVVMPHLVARWFAPNQNLLAGAWAVPAILLSLEGVMLGRRWLWTGALLASMAVVYAGSRGAYLALGAGLAWWVLRHQQRGLALRCALLIAVLCALQAWQAPYSRLAHRVSEQASSASADENYYRRQDFWRGAVTLSREAPLRGHGLGSFALAAWHLDLPTPLSEREPIARYRLSLEHAHNDWLELAVEIGWPLAVFAGLAVLFWLWKRWQSPWTAWAPGLEGAVVAALALSLFDMDLRNPGVMALVLLAAGSLAEQREAPAGPRWAWATISLCFLLSATGLWCVRQSRHPHLGSPSFSSAAAWLQPLDAEHQAQVLAHGAEPWPWAAWAGRFQAPWLSAQATSLADRDRDAVAALALEQRAALTRPYWAPGWFKLAERQSVAGRPEAEVGASIGRALALEPNFARALAWRCDQALAQGHRAEAQSLYRLIQHIQTLRYSQEEADAYSLFIQSIPPDWLRSRGPKLGLKADLGPQS